MQPKILVLDIETAPIEGFFWGLFDQNININQIKEDWFIICWSAKWVGGEVMISDRLTGKEIKKKNDKRIVKKIWELMDEADIVVAHNGDNFDVKRLNTRFLVNGLPMPSHYRSVDTLKIAKKYFSVSSNKLDYLCQTLGIGKKSETGGFELWKSCLKGDEDALFKMAQYCANDVILLEELYLKLRPYHGLSHPNANTYVKTSQLVCATCSSEELKKESKTYKTQNSKYDMYRCSNCGGLTKGKLQKGNGI